MTVHFDLHKYRQKLSVWHQIGKISDGQNDFIFFVRARLITVHSLKTKLTTITEIVCVFQVDVYIHLEYLSIQEWKYWLCFVIIDYDRLQSIQVI